jgi:hypothetical protein
MRRTKTLAALVAALVFALALGGYAYAHPLGDERGFESDLSQDGVVNVCNPDNVRPNRVATAIGQWNRVSDELGTPTLRVVDRTQFCEVMVEEWGSDQDYFYTRMVFGAHPDRLQVSPRFTELPSFAQKQGAITHEFGHALGLDHPPADETLCEESVMTTIVECSAVGVERRSRPGPHDEADLVDYWVETPIYPVSDKCWDSACSIWGPPDDSTLRTSSRESSGGGGGRDKVTSGPSSAVQVPIKVIKD